MTTAARRTFFSEPVIPLHIESPQPKPKTVCERIWEIFCCCCRKRNIEEDLGYHREGKGKGRHYVMSPSPVSHPKQLVSEFQDMSAQICLELNKRDYDKVTHFFQTEFTQLSETQRSAAMNLLKNMRSEDAFLNPNRFLQIEEFPISLLHEIRSIVSLAKIYERGQSLVYSAHQGLDLSATRVLHLSLECTYMISGVDQWGKEPGTVQEWIDMVLWGVNHNYDPEQIPDCKERSLPASPSVTFISTSQEGSSPTTPSPPYRGFPESSSQDSLEPQFDQTSKDLDSLKLNMLD